MNIDILKSLGQGYTKDFGKQRFDEARFQLQSDYPLLCRLPKSNSKQKKLAKATTSSSDIIGIGFGPQPQVSSTSTLSVSTSETKSQQSRKPIDLSTSKLATLDTKSMEAEPRIGKRKLKAIKKKLRDRTKGPQWFDMTAPEITDDRKNDLEAIKLRGALDTKRFYKRNSMPVKPKHFHVGKVVEGAADYYNARVPKKQRKRTIAEELMSELRN